MTDQRSTQETGLAGVYPAELSIEELMADLEWPWGGSGPRGVILEGVETRRRPRRLLDERAEMRATWLAMRAAGVVSARLSGWMAARLWFTPWRVTAGTSSQDREAAWLADTRPTAVPTAEGPLTGFVAGEGTTTVLLVHGWGDRAARLGGFVAPLVAAGHRVIGLDLPGHGDTGGGQTNAYALARALGAAGDHLRPLHAVIAHSMGGLTTALALQDGLEAGSVALVAPAVRLDHALDRFAAQFRLPPKAVLGLRATIERRFGTGIWAELAADSIAKRLTVPAVIVHDEDDPQVDVADARTLAAAWPDAHLVTTRGLGHQRILRDPQVIDRVRAFLA